jgi:hypothetical protein
MSKSSKQKDKKKKEREKLVKKKMLLQREAAHKERKLVLKEKELEQTAQYIAHGKPQPFIKDPAALARREAIRARTVSNKLKQNMEVLEALEREYEAEQSARSEMNAKLESEGHKTMREKMDALHQKALNITGKAESLAKATEEYAEQHKDDVEPTNTSHVEESGKIN